MLDTWRNAPPGRKIGLVGVLGAIAAAITIFTFMTNKTFPEVVAAPTPSPSLSSPNSTPSPTADFGSATSRPSASETSATATPAKPADPVPEELVHEDAVGFERCMRDTTLSSTWKAQPLVFNQIKYKNGIGCALILNGTTEGSVDFLRPTWAGTLWITAGVPDDSSNSTPRIKVTITDVISNEVLHQQEARIGEPAIMDLAASDHTRIRISMEVLDGEGFNSFSGKGIIGFAGEWRK